MELDNILKESGEEISAFVSEPNALRSLLILVALLIVAYWLSHYLAKGIVRIAQAVAVRSDAESDDLRAMKLRQVETYLSVSIAAVRAIAVAATAYFTWRWLSPASSNSIATIGASAFFIVFAGQTFGMLLRDITAGSTMIIENWFKVGDYIRVEPFIEVTGVVERLTLRSTKLRSLSGEVVWIHNQQIQAVQVTPKGVRTMAVDMFVRDRVKGEREIEAAINSIPTGPTMLASPLRISHVERWDDERWRITVVGKTLPGREWLIEKHFVNIIEDIDSDVALRADKLLVHKPIVHYADIETDRKFKRAVRVQKD